MSIMRKLPKHEDNKESLGLTAIGSAGCWEVAIDETTSGTTQKWFAQIEGPSVYLYFAVQSPRVIDEMLDFLTKQPTEEKLSKTSIAKELLSGLAAGKRTTDVKGSKSSTFQRNGEIVIGNSKEETVTIVRDEEFTDRYFLVAETKKKMVVRVTIGGTDLKSLVIALRQVKEDLDEADAD